MSRGPDSVERRLAEYRSSRRRRDPGTTGSPTHHEGAGRGGGGGPPTAAGAGHGGSWLGRLLPPLWGRGAPHGVEAPRPGKEQPQARGTLSAYSVFNPGCRPLLGAITTEQLEREMGYGAL
ncbi:unnamed protein product [Lampetra fluviatilis]